jgi:Gluconate 2-dehydrogenase subunit 3
VAGKEAFSSNSGIVLLMEPMAPPADFSWTQQQLRTLNAAADRIVPPDDVCGGADAGAAVFILRLLNAELLGERATYIDGLDGFDREAMAWHGKSFADLSALEQDAVLSEIEADRVKTAWVVSPRAFFLMLVEHVLEGFYADPGNGGNRDSASWKMVGYRAEGGTW